MPSPGETICGEIQLERLAPAALGAEVFQPVFIARNQARDERLWLTVIDSTFTPTGVDLSTFMAGANGLLGIRHPALVRVVLVDREEDYCVVGYEDLPGAEPLSDLIVRGGSRRLLARTAVEVARGLAYLHRRELLHGTLTPGTVVLWEGVPVLWEYGLAGLCVPSSFGPQARTLGGDVVAPEVPGGAPLTPAVDVFGWGAVMASVASGELGSEAVAAVLEGEVDPGRYGALFGVVRQALDPDPSRRPRNGIHLLELLQRALAAADPALDSPAVADSGPDGLGELARRYLDEVSAVGQGPSTPSAPQVAAGPGPTSPWLAASPPREPAGGRPRSRTMPPDGSATPPASVLRQGESTDVGPLPPPPPIEGLGAPDWGGRYKLPSGTYAAIRDAPQPAGDGAVRGPEPGGAGSDAGVLRLDPLASSSSAQWASRAPEVSASSWLRPAPPRATDRGVGGLFDSTKWVRELPHGLRKRWVLSGDGPPRPPLDGLPGGVPPISTGAPEAIEDDVTPSEAIPIGGILPASEPSIPGGPESERETPPDPEGFEVRALRGAQPQEPATPEPEVPPELPPLPEPSRPAAELPPADTGPARSRVQEPFRAPRLPGPHGPPAALMTLLLVLLAGTLAVGATLSAVSARGSIAALWSSGGADPGEVDEAAGGALDDDDPLAAAEARCPAGMIEIADEAGPYCIDRVEYPQIDQVPATDVSQPEAEQACAARGHQLCTEAQWVRACRGAADWPYPYGPDRQAGRCRLGDGTAHPGPAGADPTCVTPEGVLDLVGNAAEWTRDGAVLGGSVRSKKTSGCSARQRMRPSTKRPVVGFRCCLALPIVGAEAGSESGPADAP